MFTRRELMTRAGQWGALSIVGRIAAGLGLGSLVTLETACPFNTGNLLSWTNDIVSALNAASPLLTALGVPNVVALVADAVKIAEDLKAAFSGNNTGGAVALFDKLDAAFIKITNDIGLIPIAMRIPIESVLALASIAIHLIANHIQKTVVTVPGAMSKVRAQAGQSPEFARGVETIKTRAVEKPWGEYFKK